MKGSYKRSYSDGVIEKELKAGKNMGSNSSYEVCEHSEFKWISPT